jgi:hypothetical protein
MTYAILPVKYINLHSFVWQAISLCACCQFAAPTDNTNAMHITDVPTHTQVQRFTDIRDSIQNIPDRRCKKNLYIIISGLGSSVYRLATGWTVRGSKLAPSVV